MHGLDIETTALSPDEGDIRLIQLARAGKVQIFDLFEDQGSAAREAIEHADELVAHNAAFERKWLKAKLGLDIGTIHDTMIMSQVLYTGTRAGMDRRLSHSLASCVRRELQIEMDKEEQTSDWGALALTPEQKRYAAFDAAVLPKLAERLLRRLQHAGLMKTYELELRVSHAVAAMEDHGVAVHTDALDEMIEEAGTEAKRLKQELCDEWGINPGSGKQLAEYFALHKRPEWPLTPAGAPSTNQDAMRLLVPEHPEVKKWVHWKEVEKIRSTYGESLRKRLTPDGRIHARFNPFGTATGRFSSSGPNLQNIPKRGAFGKRMRGLFWSGSDDRVLIKADYASIELWVAAILWDYPHMQRALRQGVNMNVATAASLFNVPTSEVTKEQKATGKIVKTSRSSTVDRPGASCRSSPRTAMPIEEAGAVEIHRKFFARPTRGLRQAQGGGARVLRRLEVYGRGLPRGAHHDRAEAELFADRFGPLLRRITRDTGDGRGLAPIPHHLLGRTSWVCTPKSPAP